MTNIEVPSDEEVVQTLGQLDGGHTTARRLCEALMAAGHPLRQSQLAIQRTAERGSIYVYSDWTLSVVPEAVAA